MSIYIVKYIYSSGETQIEFKHKVEALDKIDAIEQVQDIITKRYLDKGYEVNNTIDTLDIYTENHKLHSMYHNFTTYKVKS